MILSLFLVLIAVVLTGISQALLKMGAVQAKDRNFIAFYLDIHVICAYTLLLIVTIISVIALEELPLKVFYSITSLNFILVIGLSIWWLKEKVNSEMIIGIFLIVGGIVVFNFP